MIIVSDTTPLHYLVLIGEVWLLPKLFGRVIIPPVVAAEMRQPKTPAIVRGWIDAPPSWIEMREPTALDPTIQLGAGEVAAISLALEINADAVLMDDWKARREAIARGLTVAGTLNILRSAALKDSIDLPSAVAKLEQTNFHLPAQLIADLLREDADRKQQSQT